MSPNRITSDSLLAEALRALALQRNRDASPIQPRGLAPHEDHGAVSPKHDVQTLRQRLHSLATEINFADTDSILRARENVVREILLWEFGNDFRTDSQFRPMVEAIGKSFDDDPAFQQQFFNLITDLRKT